MLVDGAGELIVDILTANRSLSGIPSASAILDASNYTFHAISYGKDADGFKNHAHTLLYDFSSIGNNKRSIVIFGGQTSSLNYTNVVYDVSTYMASTTTANTNPSSRKDHDITYDSYRGKLVVFGGFSGTGTLCSDTWEGSATLNQVSAYSWELKSVTGPTARYGHSMAYYDGNGGRYTILFGGKSNSGYLNDTWKWDGTSWTQIITSHSPPARAEHRIAFDSNRKKVVLFGGFNGVCLNDTWEFDGVDWVKKFTTTTPRARRLFGMTYYAGSRNQIAMVGGTNEDFTQFSNEFWLYDGNNWVNGSQSGAGWPLSSSYGGTLASIDYLGSIILFGGVYPVVTQPTNPGWASGTYNLFTPSSFSKRIYTFSEDNSIPSQKYWYIQTNSSWGSNASALVGHKSCFYNGTILSGNYVSLDKTIKVLSYESSSSLSYHTSATASALSILKTYNLLPSPPNPLDKRLELKSTIPTNYFSGTTVDPTWITSNRPSWGSVYSSLNDVGQCLNSIIDSNLSAYANFIGCFPAGDGSKFWMVSSSDYSASSKIISGTLYGVYNQLGLMDSKGFLTFAPGEATAHNNLNAFPGTAKFIQGAIRPCSSTLSFPNKVTILWALGPGDAGSLLLFGGVYHIGLWYLDLKEMLKQGYYPPYSFNALNNIRKYKLFSKKTFNKDLLYIKDASAPLVSAFDYYFTNLNNYMYLTWELIMV